ncbi:hypothetical protein P9K31_08930 [Corynebacterium glutamicum]|uniref:hypothetical protein n=1 Tax=Corynebacterium glutamicum TaxID=1718 RepID=UPI00058A5CC1|nr:hypothetical protein [Corynebacterium glutamicum]AJE67106.1 hypothetical protein SB89_05835 [Corynebacterium glutamicum]ALP49831.1 hypothetical protein AC079_06210 [Corynebacterium glutamicum]ANU33345.1 hypothetical protein BBD29_06010 [Corynebacterium glutamicum]APT07097.1 hypothetical protein BSP99_06195 [Corynebacterium glutamicum]OKX94352.1 hypothetical protein AUP72_03310 [Corynebacterium glutamicum]
MFNSDTTANLQAKSRDRAGSKAKRSRPSFDSVARDVLDVRTKTAQVKNKAKEFSSVDHLSADAAAMFVDNELSRGAMHRARLHIVHCAECREEINRQQETVDYLRSECKNEEVSAPMDLKARLASLATECMPGPGAENLAMQRPESFVAKVESVVRAVRKNQGR